MADSVKEEVLEFPEDVIEKSSGLAFDIGGSVAKLAYRSKKDYENGKPKFEVVDNKGKLRLALFTREKVDIILEYIKDNCDLSKKGDVEVCVTGFGSNRWRASFENNLSIRLNNLIEHDCFAKAVTFQASRLKGDQVFEDADQEGIAQAKKMQFAWFQTAMKAMKFSDKGKFGDGGPPPGVGGPPPGVGGPPPVVGGPPPGVGGPPPGVGGPPPGVGGPPPGVGGPPPGVGGPPPGVGGPPPGVGGPPPGVGGPPPGVGGPPPGVGGPPPGVGGPPSGVGGPPSDGVCFPCLMCILGSGVTYLRIDSDGSYKLVDGLTTGGRTFLGLGAILTGGISNFDELLDMASKGNTEGVDVYVRDLKSKDSEGDAYSIMPDDAMLFQFGKGSVEDIGKLKKEDMIASLFQQLCANFVQCAHLVAMNHGLRRVYFVGTFANNSLAKRYLTYNIVMRGRKDMGQDMKPLNTHFALLKNGGYLGAIGAFLSGKTEDTTDATHL